MANEKRLIDANALKWKLGMLTLYVPWLRCGKTVISKILESYRRAVLEEIDNAPTVDAVEVVHGRCDWCKPNEEFCGTCRKFFDYYGDGGSDRCSSGYDSPKCAYYEPINNCPNCGAKMDGDGNV